jgi:hypothetical protein
VHLSIHWLALSGWIALSASCAHQYAYVPETGVTAPMAGRVAAEYAIPLGAPRGDLRIASYGIVAVAAQAAPEKHLHALHLRIMASNRSDTLWTLDTREQRLDLDGRGQSAPAFASASPGTPPPLLTIPPSGKRVVDLFFPLPDELQNSASLPAFGAIWCIDAGGQRIVERTPFERLRAEPVEYGGYDYGPDDYYWGPPYWYNTLYPDYAFVGAVALERAFVERPVIIRHEPVHHSEPPAGQETHGEGRRR